MTVKKFLECYLIGRSEVKRVLVVEPIRGDSRIYNEAKIRDLNLGTYGEKKVNSFAIEDGRITIYTKA